MPKITKLSLIALASALIAQDPLSAACGPWGCGVGGGGGYSNQPYYPSQQVYHQGPGYYPQPQGYPAQYQGQEFYPAPQQSRYRGRPYKQAQMRAARSQGYYDSAPVYEDQSYGNDQPWGEDQYIEHHQGFSGQTYQQNQPPRFAGQGYHNQNQPAFRDDDDLMDDQGYYQPGQDQQYFSGQRLNAPRNAQTFHQGEQDFDQAPAYQPGRGPQAYSRGNGNFRNNEAAAPQSYPLEEPDFRQNQNFRQNQQNPNFRQNQQNQQNQNLQSYQRRPQQYYYSQTALNDDRADTNTATGRTTSSNNANTGSFSNTNTNNGSSWGSDRDTDNVNRRTSSYETGTSWSSNPSQKNREASSDRSDEKTLNRNGRAQANDDEDDNGEDTLIEVIADDSNLSTFAQALQAAGLTQTLSGQGPYTIFVPSNDAFQKLSAQQRQELFRPENKQKLASILSYHVVPGKLLSTDIKTGRIKTLSGKELNVTSDGSKINVNNALVTKSDVDGANGVIHIIDHVILP